MIEFWFGIICGVFGIGLIYYLIKKMEKSDGKKLLYVNVFLIDKKQAIKEGVEEK
jgi:hypothetical protein